MATQYHYPPNFGKLDYKYFTRTGEPPNQGMPPSKNPPPPAYPMFPTSLGSIPQPWPAPPPPYPAPLQPMYGPQPPPVLCNMPVQPLPPQAPLYSLLPPQQPPLSGNRIGNVLPLFPNSNGLSYIFPKAHVTVHLFNEDFYRKYQPDAHGAVNVNPLDLTNSFTAHLVPCSMQVSEFIEQIDCNRVANQWTSRIGITHLLERGGGGFQTGHTIMADDPRAAYTIGSLWHDYANGKPLYIVRIAKSSEISGTADLIQSQWPPNTNLRFKVITLNEPPKKELLPYLEAEHTQSSLPFIDRKAFVSYYIRNTDRLHEAVVNLSLQHVERNVRLGPNMHGVGDYEEIKLIEKITLEDEGVKAELAKLKLPEGTVVCADPWIYGSDGINDDERLFQVFMYMRDPANPNEPDSNHYAFPLPISPVLESNNFKVIRIDIMPTGLDNTIKPVQPYIPKPANEYIHEYQKRRTDLKPLQVIQPEGVSFKITPVGETGHYVDWQKWTFRLGYNQREGMVLYDVRYESRPLFYRVSLSDMNIPYADPRHPFHKKSAFDLGDAGAGAMANDLKLGCDCLGSIQYLSAVITDDNGQPTLLNNCVCVHEQDAGIGWKHTNYRTGRAAVVRSRELVLQSIITVSNYEYILAFMFNQAGELTYEVRATGMLSTQPIDRDLDKIGAPFGTVVHPGVLAVHHQHIFSLRIDPMIDGHSNTLVYDEALPMPLDPETNPHGNGYIVKTTPVTHSTGLDLDIETNRTFKITNPSSLNPVNNKPAAYKIHAPPFQKILSHPTSLNYKRAEFADRNIYVTTHRDDELYSAGWYTNQSRGGTGVRTWASRNDDLNATSNESGNDGKGSDIVVWVQFGINHVPRIEDFPVMPCEVLKVSLKPANFFDKNPALDVPASEQVFNKSTLVSELHKQPAVEARVNGNGETSCCSNGNGHA